MGVDMSFSYVYDKATGDLIELTGYNANTQTSSCTAGPSELDGSCSGDSSCTSVVVDCTDAGADGAAGYAGFSGAGGSAGNAGDQ